MPTITFLTFGREAVDVTPLGGYNGHMEVGDGDGRRS
jgi:hypothetical protein